VSLRRIGAILGKDLRDAFRDGRIIVLLLLPIGMAVFYNATIDDEDELPTTKVAVVEPGGRDVAGRLRATTGKSVELEIRRASTPAAARKLVADGDVALAVIADSGGGGGPVRALVLVERDASPTAQSVVALVPQALSRQPTAQVRVQSVGVVDPKPYEVVDQRTLTILIVIILLVAFVAMMVVPIQTAEELETGTFSALRLAATGPEILTSKAIAGFAYGLVGVAVTVVLTRLEVHDPLLFFGATLALTVSLVGFGLLMGLLIPHSNAINTYGAFFLFPFVFLAAAAFFVEGGIFGAILDVLPFSQAAKLLTDGLSAQSPFDAGLSAWAVIAAWALIGYALLAQITSRREI
jgi:hypothetical protein